MPSIAPSAHTRRPGITTDSWITPHHIIDALAPFDLDPCACDPQPWPTATTMLTERDDGLSRPWSKWGGCVWLNPPYGRALATWLERLARHGDGIALTFARTETKAFFDWVWPYARSMLFIRGRLTFFTPKGVPAPTGHNSGGPSVLIAYGTRAHLKLVRAESLGRLVHVNEDKFRPSGPIL